MPGSNRDGSGISCYPGNLASTKPRANDHGGATKFELDAVLLFCGIEQEPPFLAALLLQLTNGGVGEMAFMSAITPIGGWENTQCHTCSVQIRSAIETTEGGSWLP